MDIRFHLVKSRRDRGVQNRDDVSTQKVAKYLVTVTDAGGNIFNTGTPTVEVTTKSLVVNFKKAVAGSTVKLRLQAVDSPGMLSASPTVELTFTVQ